MRDVVIGKAAEFPDPGRRVIDAAGIEIGVFRNNGRFTAFENVCPHMAGPVCQGKIIARVQEKLATDRTSLGFAFSADRSNIVCPWHGYEFDIATGEHQGSKNMRLRAVPIAVIDGDVVVTLPTGQRSRIARARLGDPTEHSADRPGGSTPAVAQRHP